MHQAHLSPHSNKLNKVIWKLNLQPCHDQPQWHCLCIKWERERWREKEREKEKKRKGRYVYIYIYRKREIGEREIGQRWLVEKVERDGWHLIKDFVFTLCAVSVHRKAVLPVKFKLYQNVSFLSAVRVCVCDKDCTLCSISRHPDCFTFLTMREVCQQSTDTEHSSILSWLSFLFSCFSVSHSQ